jgi:D-alanyl-lipoteichoic acid acyltransferase DltB (MBOAT superfamily)
MFFTSYQFALLLLALFPLYFFAPQKHRWYVLLAGSLVFYAWANPLFLLYIGATIVSTFVLARKIGRLYARRDAALADPGQDRKQAKNQAKAAAWKWLLLCLLINFGIMAVVKYTDFVIANLNVVLRPPSAIGFARFAVPLGLSFYTFQTMGYIIDVYREKTKSEAHLLRFALFASFFPQIIQGPISRFGDLAHQLCAGKDLNARDFTFGAWRVLWGFFLKLVIADRLFPAWDALRTHTDQYTGAYVLVSIFLYAVILFCDFTGGIHITIGVAEMLGIRLKENFNRPFYATSIAEYWRRWHITMGAWFRDYVFYPMSVSKPMLRLSKKARSGLGEALGRRVPVYICTLSTWFLTGLWHGATWNFIAWGLANGIVILVSQEMQPFYKWFHARFAVGQTNGWYAFQIFRTFWLMCFIRSFDCYNGVGTTFRMLGSIFARFNLNQLLTQGMLHLGVSAPGFVSAGLGVAVLLWVSYLGRGEVDARQRMAGWRWPCRYALVGAVFFMTLVFGAYGLGYDARQFIYNAF